MIYSQYYHQTPIMKRILEYLGDAVYVKGSDPNPEAGKRFRRYNDIIHAMGDGSDIYRSNLDFSSLVLMIDMEYANKNQPGEIFHKPLQTFEKLESTRKSIKNILDDNKIEHIEMMTGQGYNFVMSIDRDSATYEALLKLGKATRVMPHTAAEMLLDKQYQYDNVPLMKDHLASTAFGILNDYMFDIVREESELETRTSDIFDEDEIAVFDTTLHGYLLNRRAFRMAFSLHQKSLVHPKYGYHGYPIVTIPVSGIPLEERIKIRHDERDNYRKAVELANETKTEIPKADLTSLVTDYFLSPRSKEHQEFARSLGEKELDDKDKLLLERVQDEMPGLEAEDIFWDIPDNPDWDSFRKAKIHPEVWSMFENPNEKLLQPGALRFIIKEMKDKGIDDRQIISAINRKYSEWHGWSDDLWKNDTLLRTGYWVRTLKQQT